LSSEILEEQKNGMAQKTFYERHFYLEQQGQLLRFVFSNLSLDGEKLHYDLNKPFDAIGQSANCAE
jgi:hypothetical protein